VIITNLRGDIDFQNVCFKYPSRPNVQIFKDLSLSIPSGKVKFNQKKAVIYTFLTELNFSDIILADCCTSWGEWEWEVHSDCTTRKVL